jgi:perosamine synthetase
MYQETLADDDRLIVPQAPANSRMSWFVFVVRLADRYTQDQRNTLLKKLLDRGIQVSNYFPPVHLQPFIAEEYGCKEGDMPITDTVVKGTVALPFHNHLTQDDVELVCRELRGALAHI